MANRTGTHGATSHRGGERANAFSYDHADAGSTAGYSRPDDRLREDIGECLTYDSLLDGAEIEVEVEEGQVTLRGAVASKSERPARPGPRRPDLWRQDRAQRPACQEPRRGHDGQLHGSRIVRKPQMADLALAMSTAASNRASTYLLGEPMEFQQVVLG